MTYAVLGSNSFTGSHFIDYLLANSDEDIIAISRSPEYPASLLPYRYRKSPDAKRFTFHQLDLNSNLNEILEILDRARANKIVNFAAQGEVRNSWRWPEHWFRTNTMSVVSLSDELVKRDYIRSYYAASTPEAYGNTGVDRKEDHHYLPSTPYAVSKLAGDLHLLSLHKRYGFPAVFTRAANVYGIHQQLYRIIPRAIIYIKMGKKIELHGGGRAIRSFIHIRDVSDAIFKVINQGAPGEVYHVSPEGSGISGAGISIADVVRLVCSFMGCAFEEVTSITEENFSQDALFSLNSDKIQSQLGWKPQVTFEAGIQETIKWIEENWAEISSSALDYVHKE